MESLKFWRTRLGLSQQNMADLLGLSPALVALVETGKRSLPPRARDWLARLALVEVQVPEPPLSFGEVPDEKTQRLLESRLKKLRQERHKVQADMAALEEKCQTCQRLAHWGVALDPEVFWPEGELGKDAWALLLRKNKQTFNRLRQDRIFLKIREASLEAAIAAALAEKKI